MVQDLEEIANEDGAHLLRDYFPEIDVESREKLAREVSSCEIVVSLNDMKPYKALARMNFNQFSIRNFGGL